MNLRDPQMLREEYATEERYVDRRLDGWAEYHGGDPADLALDALREVAPRRVLDAGCGPAEFASRVARELGVEVVALDLSPRMVELARARGLAAVVGDVQALPFADEEFDCAVANWMLYHVPDLDRALSELARVLRPGGRLVAVTNSERHLEEIWGRDDGEAFSRENGRAPLERQFARVEVRDHRAHVVFREREALRGYLRAFNVLHGRDETSRAESVEFPLRATCWNVTFVADKAAA